LSRIPADELFPDRVHQRGCLCVSCGTAKHPDDCVCLWCGQRRYWEGEYEERMRRAARAPVPSDVAAGHVAKLGLTRRELAARLHCSLSTSQRISKPGGFIPRELERRVLELIRGEKNDRQARSACD
jgi:hypothetical protein